MTHKFRNVSPLGELDIPVLVREPVEAGEVFAVDDDLVEYFDAQPSNFEPVGDDVPTTIEVREQEAEAARLAEEKAAADAAEKAAKAEAAAAAKAATKTSESNGGTGE